MVFGGRGKKIVAALKGKEKSPAEQKADWQFKQEVYESRQKGRLEGAKSRAYEEGKRQGAGSGGRLERAATIIDGFGSSVNRTEKNWGFSNIQPIGGGLDITSGGSMFDLGMGGSRAKKPAGKVTRIKTSSGQTITVRDPPQQEQQRKRQMNTNFLEDLDDNPIAF